MKKLNKIFLAHSHKGGHFLYGNIFFHIFLQIGKQLMYFQHRSRTGSVIKAALRTQAGEKTCQKEEKAGIHFQRNGRGVPTDVQEGSAQGVRGIPKVGIGVDSRRIALLEQDQRISCVEGEKSDQEVAALIPAECGIAVTRMKKEDIPLRGGQLPFTDLYHKRTLMDIPYGIVSFCLGFPPVCIVTAVVAEFYLEGKAGKSMFHKYGLLFQFRHKALHAP